MTREQTVVAARRNGVDIGGAVRFVHVEQGVSARVGVGAVLVDHRAATREELVRVVKVPASRVKASALRTASPGKRGIT